MQVFSAIRRRVGRYQSLSPVAKEQLDDEQLQILQCLRDVGAEDGLQMQKLEVFAVLRFTAKPGNEIWDRAEIGLYAAPNVEVSRVGEHRVLFNKLIFLGNARLLRENHDGLKQSLMAMIDTMEPSYREQRARRQEKIQRLKDVEANIKSKVAKSGHSTEEHRTQRLQAKRSIEHHKILSGIERRALLIYKSLPHYFPDDI